MAVGDAVVGGAYCCQGRICLGGCTLFPSPCYHLMIGGSSSVVDFILGFASSPNEFV
uniref:Uncharacterized protein n=1 Tax=Musa acuminata subsp. malaccensis TaxID=214687 RepID=A0A804KP95_MUSAM